LAKHSLAQPGLEWPNLAYFSLNQLERFQADLNQHGATVPCLDLNNQTKHKLSSSVGHLGLAGVLLIFRLVNDEAFGPRCPHGDVRCLARLPVSASGLLKVDVGGPKVARAAVETIGAC